METKKDTFVMRKSWFEQMKQLDDTQRGKLVLAIYKYQCSGEDFVTTDSALNMLWSFMKRDFDYNDMKYKEQCDKNRENANIRWKNT